MTEPSIYLVRHATPDWSRTDLPYHIPPGPPLTAQGEAEAGELGQYLSASGVAAIFGSPLERCWRTAQIAAGAVGLEPVLDLALTEIKPGERPDEIYGRVLPAWQRAAASVTAGTSTVLVTHGGPISILLDRLGLLPEALNHYKKLFDRSNPLPPAGAWQAVPANGGWQLSLAFTPQSYRSKLIV